MAGHGWPFHLRMSNHLREMSGPAVETFGVPGAKGAKTPGVSAARKYFRCFAREGVFGVSLINMLCPQNAPRRLAKISAVSRASMLPASHGTLSRTRHSIREMRHAKRENILRQYFPLHRSIHPHPSIHPSIDLWIY